MLPRWAFATLALLALGATLGPLLDAIHTYTGTTAYPEPWVFLMAWWTPLLFSAGGPAIGLARPILELRRGERAPRPSGRRVALGMGLFVLSYALSGTVPGGNVVRSVALAAVFLASWWTCDRTRLGFGLSLAAGAGGCVLEVCLTHAGAFRHLQPDVLGIPLWLPWLYAAGQVALGNLAWRWVAPGPAA